MRRFWAMAGTAVFLVVAPGTIAVLVPRWISHWRAEESEPWLRVAGAILIAVGATVLLDSFGRFAWQGLGTPAPPFPTRHLIVTGLYRYVRNPMYLAVISLIAGQAAWFGNERLLGYGAAVWMGFHLFVIGYEEPVLQATYGPEYDQFFAAVPRWIPRLHGWRGHP